MAPTKEAHKWSFAIPLLLFSLACGGVTWVALYFAHEPFAPVQIAVLCYFATLSFILLAWQEQALVSDPKGFVRRFMLGMVLKMFISLGILFYLISILDDETEKPFAATFILLYMAFLGFTTVRLVTRLRATSAT
ncbi:MAG: hypothetical protein WAR83_03120 [Flavobacteriales bacterium]